MKDYVQYFFAALDLHLAMEKPAHVAIDHAVMDYAEVFFSKGEIGALEKEAREALKRFKEKDFEPGSEEEQEYWTFLRQEANRIHSILQTKPDEYKIGYKRHPGAILNAYREGDISWQEAVDLLGMKK